MKAYLLTWGHGVSIFFIYNLRIIVCFCTKGNKCVGRRYIFDLLAFNIIWKAKRSAQIPYYAVIFLKHYYSIFAHTWVINGKKSDIMVLCYRTQACFSEPTAPTQKALVEKKWPHGWLAAPRLRRLPASAPATPHAPSAGRSPNATGVSKARCLALFTRLYSIAWTLSSGKRKRQPDFWD